MSGHCNQQSLHTIDFNWVSSQVITARLGNGDYQVVSASAVCIKALRCSVPGACSSWGMNPRLEERHAV